MPNVREACVKEDILFYEKDNTLFVNIANDESLILEIPISFKEDNVEYVKINGVLRPTCKYGLSIKVDNTRSFDTIVDFDTFMYYTLFKRSDITGVNVHGVSVYDVIHKITSGRDNNFVSGLIRITQRFINDTINMLPLHKTTMNSWAVNRRVSFIDDDFENIVDPNEKLKYQIEKADKYFDKGWTLMGLSDSNLADCNYIFQDDLRRFTPFGIKHHNPQRNLYQTLGMKGDELPAIRSRSQHELIQMGIERTGWNVPTLFVDIPLNFEDQIMIHRKSWENRTSTVKSVTTIYGDCFVKKGAELHKGETIGLHMDGKDAIFNLEGSKHIVKNVVSKPFVMGDINRTIYSVVVETTRHFKEGFKLTNIHGNKGIVRMFDSGYVIHDTIKGDIVPQVVVSLKSITKRKNFGQICEAIASRCVDCSAENPLIVEDDSDCDEAFMLKRLKDTGYDTEVVDVDTPYGPMKAIWGNVFWGCIKTAEENVWDFDSITEKNNKGVYKRGLKFSHMEFRSLITIFGPANPVAKEILRESNGSEYVKDKLEALIINPQSRPELAVVDCKCFNTIGPSSGIMHEEEDFKFTVADPEVFPNGAIVTIPQTTVTMGEDKFAEEITINNILLPAKNVREYWQHKSGLKAVDAIGMALNNVIHYAKTKDILLSYWLKRYFEILTKSLGSKTGNIAQIGMAVRYPKSVKATAVGSDTLPKNTIEIHRNAAKYLHVKTGDPVLVERFPCLGFMSLRVQYVKVTDDEDCRYTFRVSGNSLISQNLDFDGDTLYIAAFHTPEAREALYKLLKDDALYVNKVIEKMNLKSKPCIHFGGFDELGLVTFPKLTKEEHRKIVSRAVGVKAHTGPVIALAYNLMRITETKIPLEDMKTNVDIEVMLDFLGNTVFAQKHGIKALHDEAINAICTGNVAKMVECGFNESTSKLVIDIINQYALKLGVKDLVSYHKQAREKGKSNIINRIVRKYNKVYFASRAVQTPDQLLEYINSEPNDIPSALFNKIIFNR